MEAVEFLKLRRRFCSVHDCGSCMVDGCVPAANDTQIEQYVAAIIKWGEEHPIRTRKSEFLKMFPDAMIADDGMPDIDPCDINQKILGCCSEGNCEKCRREFWLKEIEG